MENNNRVIAFAVLAMSIAGIVSVGAISLNSVNSQENETATEAPIDQPAVEAPESTQDNTSVTTETEVAGSFAKVKTTQNQDYISILITKNPEEAAPPVPEVPVIIVPGEGENGTIVVPPGNATDGNVTIIDPIGNVTQIPDGNVTIIDNDTVVVTPPDENVTETPGNVTVIDPEPQPEPVVPGNETGECTCPPAGEIPPVEVTPAPGQNVTVPEPEPMPPTNETTTEPEPEPIPEPPANETTTEEPAPGGDNETGTEEPVPPAPVDNQTVTDGNQTNIENSTIEVNPAGLFQDPNNHWLTQIGLT